jgi:hypothetical protein
MIVQAGQRPDDAPDQGSASARPRYDPSWKELHPDPRKRTVVMAEALNRRKITTSQGATYGGSETFWNVQFPVIALSFILSALEAEFEG